MYVALLVHSRILSDGRIGHVAACQQSLVWCAKNVGVRHFLSDPASTPDNKSTMKILQSIPAATRSARELHDRLVETGQSLRDSEMPSFLLTVTGGDGKLTAGCKGEIAFASAHVSELWVSEDHRGQGLGSALLAEAEQLAQGKGCCRIHLETRNERARRLYERVGYHVFGTLPDYDGTQAFYYLEKSIQEQSDDKQT